MHTYNPLSMSSINFIQFMVSNILPGQNVKGQGQYSKVKSRPHHNLVHLQPLSIVPTKYQFPTGFQTRFYRSRSLWQGQRSNQGHTMTFHTYNSQPMSLPSINFLHLMVSEIQPGQDFIGQGLYCKVKGQINVTP